MMTEFDLGALVIRLCAMQDTSITNHMGRAVHRFGLKIVEARDADLSEEVHDTDDSKPFVTSGLMDARSPEPAILLGQVDAGTGAWVRICGLSAEVVTALEAYRQQVDTALSRGQAVYAEIDHRHWQVESVTWTDHPWAGLTSYQTLLDHHRHAKPSGRIRLCFATATTFRSQTLNVPLPKPSLVFGSLLNRWQTFTNLRLRDLPDDQVMAFINHHIALSQFEARSMMYQFKGKEVGFAGWAAYDLIPKSEYLEKHAHDVEVLLRREHLWMTRVMHLLADFAFYSSIGRKTTSGMGMSRRV